MARRSDLLVEVDTVFDGAGNYTGDWIDTAGVRTVALLRVGASAASIEYSIDGSTVLAVDNWASAEKTLPARYFRLTATGTANGVFRASVRAMD